MPRKLLWGQPDCAVLDPPRRPAREGQHYFPLRVGLPSVKVRLDVLALGGAGFRFSASSAGRSSGLRAQAKPRKAVKFLKAGIRKQKQHQKKR